MNIETINKWLDEEYGCSYTRLEELHDFYFEKYCDLQKENQELKAEYGTKTQIERDLLKEENEKLKAELQLYQGALKRENEAIHKVNDLEEVIDKAIEYINKYAWQEDIIGGIYTTTGKPAIDRYMQLEWDNCNELLDILKEVEETDTNVGEVE